MKGSFTIRHNKKDGRRFTYSGDLKAAIDKAEKELSSKMSNTTKRLFLLWTYDRAKKELEAWDRRIVDLKDFIRLAKEELQKQEEGGKDGTE